MICPGFDFRIRGTRCSCTAPCKEQAGNREHSFAPVFYTHRLVLGSDQARILLCASSRQNARPLPALMLRSIAALRCVSKHEGAPDLVLILRDARTRVRVGGTISHARSSG
jgi:hypothetical protein